MKHSDIFELRIRLLTDVLLGLADLVLGEGFVVGDGGVLCLHRWIRAV